MNAPPDLYSSILSEFLATVTAVRAHRPGLTAATALAEAFAERLDLDPADGPIPTGWDLVAAAALHAHLNELAPAELLVDALLEWIDTQGALHYDRSTAFEN